MTLFKSDDISSIKLFIKDENNTIRKTEILYDDSATLTLDRGLDAGTFTGLPSNFDLFSRLIKSYEGVNFMRQALPKLDYETMVIPLGLISETNKEITFTAEVLNLPAGIKVYLEDRLTNTFTRLDEVNSKYEFTTAKALNGIGRFYLHTSQSVLSIDDDKFLSSISIFKTSNFNLRIVGLSQEKASISLINTLGKKVLSKSFISNNSHDISLPKLAAGIYFVNLQTEKGKLTKKIILE